MAEGNWRVRGVRGAITVVENTQMSIREATLEVFIALIQANTISPSEVVMVLFSCTPDLDAGFPSQAVRETLPAWELVPLLDLAQLDVQGSLPRCLRVILQFNTPKTQAQVRPIYLRGAMALRPDLVQINS
ncbi:chorismate mutase [Candidatus Cyanaurora vandensis]|uniref:chorismate mutase n=1 Tax=Candidatus Cyanaurora vandensis TaxID=2714958 RepID=UPI00257A8B49|nr:chorismate mutase [Candidatus Cyanaurora vandensis]